MKYLLAVISGCLIGLSQPVVIGFISDKPVDPTGLTGLLAWVAYAPLFVALNRVSGKKAFCLTVVTGFFQFMIITHWVIIAMNVFGGVSLVLATLGSMLLSLVLAFYAGLFIAAMQWASNYIRVPSIWLYPVAITAADLTRNYIIAGGFPWGSIGYSLATLPIFVQTASLVGVYGLVFILAFSGALLAQMWMTDQNRLLNAGALVLLLVVMLAHGYRQIYWQPEFPNQLRIALLQGNVEQGIKNKQHLYTNEILARYRNLQADALDAGVQLSLWPESAIPLKVPSDAKRLYTLGDTGEAAIIGATVFEPGKDKMGHFHNSALVLGADDVVIGRFDKTHLVPFGEYVPWPFDAVVSKIVPNLGAFKPGEGFDPIRLPISGKDIRVGTTICYEGVFPEISRAFTNNGANLLVNVTNDAWYGVSSAPYQHLNMYVLRSIENARTTVRATNTGISAWIDPRGFVNEATPLYKEALVVTNVPIGEEKTIYQILGDAVPIACLIMVLIWMLMASVRRYRGKRTN